MGLEKDVMLILPKLMEYEKSRKWLEVVVWINDVNEIMEASSDYVKKKNIENI